MKTTHFKTSLLCGLILAAASCKRDEPITPEIPPSDGTQMTLQGGAGVANAVNAVYVDLSSETQTSIARNSWNLGFYAGSDFRVIINNQTQAAALATTFTDINAVNTSNVDVSAMFFSQGAPSAALFDLVDDSLGRINNTAIAAISATASQNVVYIYTPELQATANPANMWKIRILRNGNTGYTLQYARLTDTNFQTATISKDPTDNFQFFSLTSGPTRVEPQRADWDFVWSRSMYLTVWLGQVVPYPFSDIIFTNHLAGVETAEVIIGGDFTTSYTDFNESHLNQITLTSSRNNIGSTWRSTSPATGAFRDRYYIIRDSSNNIYKLRFIGMGVGGDGADRGYPQLEYKLIKEG